MKRVDPSRIGGATATHEHMTTRLKLRRIAWVLPALTLLSTTGSGCEGDELSVGRAADLEREDVVDLPAGSATGTGATGRYILTTYDQRACSCRQGDEQVYCDAAVTSQNLQIAEIDGILLLQEDEPNSTTEFVLGGGIDADGSVLIGGVNAAVNRDTGEQVGETFTLVEGELQRMQGAELDWEYRVRLIDAGTSVDCAVVADVTLAWVGG